MFPGALAVGVLTAFLTQVLHNAGNVPEDSSMGVVFASLFAIGVVIISRYPNTDLDVDCVLYGHIEFVALMMTRRFGIFVPDAFVKLSAVLLLTVGDHHPPLGGIQNRVVRSDAGDRGGHQCDRDALSSDGTYRHGDGGVTGIRRGDYRHCNAHRTGRDGSSADRPTSIHDAYRGVRGIAVCRCRLSRRESVRYEYRRNDGYNGGRYNLPSPFFSLRVTDFLRSG